MKDYFDPTVILSMSNLHNSDAVSDCAKRVKQALKRKPVNPLTPTKFALSVEVRAREEENQHLKKRLKMEEEKMSQKKIDRQ